MTTTPGVEARLLGPLRIDVCGSFVPIGGGHMSRLLSALLVNANAVVATGRLVDDLWEDPPLSARQQVHNVVAVLRREFAAVDGIEMVTTRTGYRVDIDEGLIDLYRFRTAVRLAEKDAADGRIRQAIERLKAARALWLGEPFGGLEGRYLGAVAARLTEERLSAVETLMALRLRAGEAAQVTGELTELVAEHPLRESLRANLMSALYATGRQAHALTVYEEGRRLLAEEYGLDPGADITALHGEILRGTPGQVAAPAEPRPVVAALPRQYLPHDTHEFSGRSAELARLVAESRRPGSTSLVISAINGMGGIGKTALAVHFAHEAAADFPDGQYFVDLRGFTIGMEPRSAHHALGALLRQAGVAEELLPTDVDGRMAAWRAAVAGRQALVTLDNAVDAAQVRPLLPGTNGPVVLVTSRRRLTSLDGAVPLPLDLMPVEDCVKLFVRIAGAERTANRPDTVADIVELCGRLPLAVRIAAARFRDRRAWTLDRLRDQLLHHRTRFLDLDDRGVSTVLGLSYEHLPEPARRLFRLLSLHPGASFDAHIAAALGGVPVETAEDVLERLFDDSLVSQDVPGRYGFHDLIRDCSSQLRARNEPPEEQADAFDRLLDYSLAAAVAWCQPQATGPFRFTPPDLPAVALPPPTGEDTDLLRSRHADLIDVARAAVNTDAGGRASALVVAIQPLLRTANYADPARYLFDRAVAMATAAGDERGQALARTGLGLVLREHGQLDASAAEFRTAMAISRRLDDRLAEAYQLNDLGVAMVYGERFTEAYGCFRDAFTLVEPTGDDELRATLNHNLGLVGMSLGKSTDSFEHLMAALETYRALDRQPSVVRTLVNLGLLMAQEGRFHDAADRLLGAASMADANAEIRAKAAAHAGLCVVRRSIGDCGQALVHGRLSLRLADEHQLLDVECDALNALGEANLADRNIANAETSFQHAADLARRRTLRSREARAYEGLAHVAALRGDAELARSTWAYALMLYPDDTAEAANARAHLDAPPGTGVRCLRCVDREHRGLFR